MNRLKIIVVSSIIIVGLVAWSSLAGFSNVRLTDGGITELVESPSVYSNKYIKEYSLPDGTWPNGILVDKNGNVWVAGSRIYKLFKFQPSQEEFVSSFQIKNPSNEDEPSDFSLMVWTMVEDNDGMIWFSQLGPDKIWRFDPNLEKFYNYDSRGVPFQMKSDRNTGHIWFTTLTTNTIGVIQKINSADGNPEYKITEFALDSDVLPSGIFLEKENVWITQLNNNKLSKYVTVRDDNGFVTDISKILEVPTTNENLVFSPTDMVILNDSSIWVNEHGTSFVTRFNDHKTVKKFPTSQNQFQATSLPFWIKGTKEGKGFWFNEHAGNKIGFFDTTKMQLIEYEIPTRPSDGYLVYPLNIAMDPTNDDLLWFSEWNTDKIAVVDKSTPIPFDIVSEVDTLIQDNGNARTATITVSIIKNQNESSEENKHNIILLNASSSLELNASLADTKVSFSINPLNLTEIDKKEKVDVILHDIPTTGNYTFSISASNGLVTKSVFFELINK